MNTIDNLWKKFNLDTKYPKVINTEKKKKLIFVEYINKLNLLERIQQDSDNKGYELLTNNSELEKLKIKINTISLNLKKKKTKKSLTNLMLY